MQPNRKIALLIANSGSAYYLLKALHRQGYTVDVIHYEPHFIDRSRYINRFHLVHSPFEDAERCVSEIIGLSRQQGFHLIVPVNDVAMELVYELKSSLGNVLLHNPAETDRFRSKIELWKLVEKLGLPNLKGREISTLDEYEQIRDNTALPVVAKPGKSARIIRSRLHKFGVRVISRLQELDNFVHDNINNTSILLQEPIQGFGVGFNFFSVNGELKSYYAHARLTEYNGGGASSHRKTIPADTYNLLETSTRIIREMNWTGIGMLEYRVADNTAYIMELNGRPWGSLMLGIKSGCDPISHYIRWALTGSVPAGTSYKAGIAVRKLKEDIKNNLKEARRRRFMNLPAWLWSFAGLLTGKEFVEDLHTDDLKFARQYWLPEKSGQHSAPANAPVLSLNPGDRICFVCFGNINRSPFAEAVLKQLRPDLEVCSAGIMNISNRNASRQAIAAARVFHTDLEPHRSQYIREVKDLQGYKLVVMDDRNVQGLAGLGITRNVFRLSNENIPDPHGRDDAYFLRVYTQISDSVNQLNKPIIAHS